MQLTVDRVYPKAREWTGQYGASAAVKVLFSDGSEGEYVTKPEKVEEIKATLTGLVGKPSEFEVEDKPEYKGVAQRKIKVYPGKPHSGNYGGGGSRVYTPDFTKTKEGAILDETMTNARTALMQAVTAAGQHAEGPLNMPYTLTVAAEMFRWLQSNMESALKVMASVTPAPAPAPSQAPAPSNGNGPTHANGNGGQAAAAGKLPKGTLNETGAPCGQCHAPSGKPHLSPCV